MTVNHSSTKLTIATWITLSRMVGIPLMLWFLNNPTVQHRWWGLLCFAIAAGTDWLDGYVARRFNQISDLGKLLDPLVDKLLVMAALLWLVEQNIFPVWGVFVILAREIVITAWRSSQTTVSGANLWGKLKTVSQIVAIALAIAPLGAAWSAIVQVGFWLAVSLSVISGVLYVLPAKQTPTTPQTP